MRIFVKQNNNWVIKDINPENTSINGYMEALGYDTNQFYMYTDYEQSYGSEKEPDSITCVCLKVMSEEIICVLTEPNRAELQDIDVQIYMAGFDYSIAYGLYSMESDLDEAIQRHNYSIQFVADALGVPYKPTDKELFSSKFNYFFYFENGYLVGYEIADGYNREARELKDMGSWLFTAMEEHAEHFHGVSSDASRREINIQAKAFYGLPAGMENPYLEEYKNKDGSYNFMMLLVTKYQGEEYEQAINYDDCKCICHNELIFEDVEEQGFDKLLKYRYRNYVLSFDEKGSFTSCVYSENSSEKQISSENYQKTEKKETDYSRKVSTASGNGCMVVFVSIVSLMMMFILVFTIISL